MKKLNFFTFCFYVIGSTCLISGSSYAIYFGLANMKKKGAVDPAYTIRAIIQTGPQKEALKTVYLAELMGLSFDQPKNLYLFDEKKAEHNLLNSPLIESAKVKKKKPPFHAHLHWVTSVECVCQPLLRPPLSFCICTF